MDRLIKVVSKYFDFGWNCFPTGIDRKHPCIPEWKDADGNPVQMTKDTFSEYYRKGGGIWASGRSMGNIDFDTKNEVDKSEAFYFTFLKLVSESSLDIFEKIGVQRTPSGGYHWIFSIDFENTKSKSSLTRSSLDKVIIETRGGEQGIMLFPSPGYELIKEQKGISFGFGYDKPLTSIEYDSLCDIAKTLCKAPAKVYKPKKRTTNNRQYDTTNIFDEFNNSHDIVQVMESFGYKIISSRGNKLRVKSPETSAKDSGTVMVDDQVYFNHSESTMGGVKSATSAAIVAHYQFADDWKDFRQWLCRDKVFTEDDYQETTQETSPFIKWLYTIFDETLVNDVIKEYYVGAKDGKTIFWQIDQEKNIINSCAVDFTFDNDRNRYVRIGREYKGNPTDKYGYSLFGAHMMKEGRNVALFQNEEDALFYRIKFLSGGQDVICMAIGDDDIDIKKGVSALKSAKAIGFYPNISNGKFKVPKSLCFASNIHCIEYALQEYVTPNKCLTDYTPIDKAISKRQEMATEDDLMDLINNQ